MAEKTLAEIIPTLSTAQLLYVAQRAWLPTNKEAAHEAGISEGTIYTWENKPDVDRAWKLMQQDGALIGRALFQRYVPQAAMVLIESLSHRSVNVRIKAAKEILDRAGVVPGQHIDVTSGGEKLETRPDAQRVAEAIAILGGCGKGSCSGCES